MPSIAAIATGDARFNILVAALQYIDRQLPGSNLVATLAAPNTDVTVFAPTDAAFTQLARDLGYTGSLTNETAVSVFIATAVPVTTLRDVILYHVSAGAKTLDQIASLPAVSTLNGATIRPDGVTLVDREPDLINPSLVQTNIQATNGIVHVIDRVLLPVNLPGNTAPTITGLVAQSGTFDSNGADFDLLLAAVQAAGLGATLNNPNADLTVFAPNDAAFLSLATTLGFAGTGESAAFTYIVDALTLLSGGTSPIPLLTDILSYHVLPESLQASQIRGQSALETLLGVDLGVSGTTLIDADPDLVNPRLIATDIQTANGVVHVIDRVLIPANILPTDGSNAVNFVISSDRGTLIQVRDDNDFVDAKGGNDTVLGGEGNDVLLGGSGSDSLFGHEGNDILRGGANSDTIYGGANNDVIDGGIGLDTLFGGAGNDSFVFAQGYGADTIFDFRNGQDRINVAAFGIETFAEITGVSSRHGGTLINFGDGDRIFITGLSTQQLDASDFLFA